MRLSLDADSDSVDCSAEFQPQLITFDVFLAESGGGWVRLSLFWEMLNRTVGTVRPNCGQCRFISSAFAVLSVRIGWWEGAAIVSLRCRI